MLKMTCSVLAAALTLAVSAAPVSSAAPSVRRIFRAPRVTRGDTNLRPQQPLDLAAWIWGAGAVGREDANGDFLKFRRTFEVKEGDGKLVFDVSADERFILTLDGAFVARGPNRASVENWQYQSYETELAPGEHVFEATVWRTGDHGPLAQLSWRGGFVFKAEGAYDARLTTGKAAWQVGRLEGFRPAGADAGVWGTGKQWRLSGTGVRAAEPKSWSKAVVVREAIGTKWKAEVGHRIPGWMLYPTQLPDQTETRVRPGRFVAATTNAAWRAQYVYSESETNAAVLASFNDLLAGRSPSVTVPARTRLQLAWDLGVYMCAYPNLETRAAKGARVSWTWAEATRTAGTKLKGSQPGARNAIVGRYLEGYGDTFETSADCDGSFEPPWFRCGKWCRLDIETGDEPLEIRDLALVESRYPLEEESAFVSADDPTLADIRRIGVRAIQMCCHEMLFDCPFYEQQMYPGDSRVQLNVLSALTRDERMIRRCIELFDLAARDDGQVPFNWPTRGLQEGATYTLCYLLMYGDYAMNHADRAWLKARLPGFRRALSGMELLENDKGLLENLPGWSFVDWVETWKMGVAPDGSAGEGVSAVNNLLWLLALRSAVTTERAFGNDEFAAYWERKADRLAQTIYGTFWSEERGLVADTVRKDVFSEHAQCLALLGGAIPADRADAVFGRLITDADLSRCTVYFSFYLFETYFKYGRGDLFLKRLDLWRAYLRKGLTTTQEAPDSGKNGQKESRSDCHAWGAHPIWFMQTGLAGIRSAAPFFARVLVAPNPGGLTELTARHPHPDGWIVVDLKFAEGRATGTVETPVAGEFRFGNQVLALVPGRNEIR